MKTDDLIDALSREIEPQQPTKTRGPVMLGATIGLGVAAAALIATLGVRPDIGVSLPAVLAKAGFSAALAATALPLLFRLLTPGKPLGWRIAAAGGAVVLSLVIAGLALMGEAPGQRMDAWTGGGFPWCLLLIPALATPAAAAVTWLVRDMAPTRLPLAGGALGGFAGGIGAMVYAAYCPVDSVAFVATWYALAIALTAGLGAVIASRFLRW